VSSIPYILFPAHNVQSVAVDYPLCTASVMMMMMMMMMTTSMMMMILSTL